MFADQAGWTFRKIKNVSNCTNKSLFCIRLESTDRQWVSILKRHKIQFAYFYCNIPMLIKIIVTHSELTFRVDYKSARPFISGENFPTTIWRPVQTDELIQGLYVIDKRKLITSKIWNNQSEWRSFLRLFVIDKTSKATVCSSGGLKAVITILEESWWNAIVIDHLFIFDWSSQCNQKLGNWTVQFIFH